MARAYVGIGSNLGDRLAHCEAALEGLAALGRTAGGSSIYETAPIGSVDQDPFLNAVVALDTDLGPEELLVSLLGIEGSRGRRRDVRWGPRTLDLDLLWYDGVTLDLPGLTLPHPEIRNRRFVLAPLLQVHPGLSDAVAPYADALAGVADQAIRRVSGPVHPDGTRWMVAMDRAIDLARSGDRWTFEAHPDWANTSGDMFGAYLSAVSLFVMRDIAPRMSPISLHHRFIAGVPTGVVGAARITIDRETDRSIDGVVTLEHEGKVVGRSTISALASVPPTRSNPVPPEVSGIESAVPISRLISGLGASVGLSSLGWGSLQNWNQPDLNDGSEPVVRAWSPNLALGSNDPYFAAAAMLVPIDAAIWPATMQSMGLLPHGPGVATPTIEFGGAFVNMNTDDLFHLAEASIDHRTTSSVSGSVRVWGNDGGYLATGHSYNLITPRT